MNARRRRRRDGFTILEVYLSSVLMLILALLTSQAWSAFGRPATMAAARIRLAQEANLAAEALARDVGQLARPGGSDPDQGQPSVQFDGSALTLRVDDGTDALRTIVYEVAPDLPGRLIRTDAGRRRVVAALVADFRGRPSSRPAEPGGEEVAGVEVELTLSHRVLDRDPDGSFRGDYTRRYTLFIEVDEP